jgi:23S rRNA (adenine2503-C2)-methyltransferase
LNCLHERGKYSILSPAVSAKPKQLVQLDAAEPARGSRKTLFGLDLEALTARMVEAGEPSWRGRQLAEALYRQRIAGLDAITTLPKPLRHRLPAEGWEVGRPRIAQVFKSVDGTERYLVECSGGDGLLIRPINGIIESHPSRKKRGMDGAPNSQYSRAGSITVETVWMPEGDGGEAGDGSEAEEADQQLKDREVKRWERATICVSSQVGCAVNCQFCLTARLGLQRNLTAGEIAGQVVAVFERQGVEVGRDRVNLVFMGMGEPFLNYDNFMGAVRLLVEEVGLSPRRMTVSTSGIVPGIERFAQEPAEARPNLAISLNAPNDRIRGEIMPVNKKWPIESVMDAVRKIQLRPRERITFEYVLLGGVTDRPEHAREVARLARRTGLPVKVNLIAWNPGLDFQYTTPEPESVERFRIALAGEGIPVYVRRPRGRDIFAACGQLKRTVEKN